MSAVAMRSDLCERVAAIVRRAAAEAIMPRFRTLADGDVTEKTPGEEVTIADREAEALIAAELPRLLPGSRVVGEEAAAATPEILAGLDAGDVWLVDPLDGTANFIAGRADFAIMVGLLRAGWPTMAWMLSPVGDSMHVAARGEGAFVDGVRVRTSSVDRSVGSCRGAVLTRFLPDYLKDRATSQGRSFAEIRPGTRCAGVDYPRIVEGDQHFAMFWRALPWDHVPGALFLTEAGGHVARLDRSAYRPADLRPGLLAAENAEVWAVVHDALVGTAD